ncbi:hypothetical protein TNCV_4967211 [Trichonephila clavipes]|nr:hypothetical protein TNCV_4967211 [Trichonephila clavipes]
MPRVKVGTTHLVEDCYVAFAEKGTETSWLDRECYQYSSFNKDYLTAIKYSWFEALGGRVAQRTSPPRAAQELKIDLRQKWDNISQALIDSLVKSIENRCKLVHWCPWSTHILLRKNLTLQINANFGMWRSENTLKLLNLGPHMVTRYPASGYKTRRGPIPNMISGTDSNFRAIAGTYDMPQKIQ